MDRKIDESIELFQKAIERKPNFIEAELNLALAYHRKFGTEREIVQLGHVLAIDPHNIVARNILTRRLEETGKFDEALKMALETVLTTPESAEARLFAGKGLLRNGDSSGAGRATRGGSSRRPFHGRGPPSSGGQHFASSADQEDASKEVEREEALRELQHTSIAANIQMSQVNSKLENGDTNGAIAVLQQVIQSETWLGGCPHHSGQDSVDAGRHIRGI